MRRLTTFVALCLAVVVMLAPQPAAADRRVALVIGNSAYKQVPTLNNPANDAADLAAKLGGIGFDVLRGIDLDYAGMRDIIRRFGDKLTGADVALMFYAGHGLQVAGKNYLVPVDARISNQADLDLAHHRPRPDPARDGSGHSAPTSCSSTPAATIRWRRSSLPTWARDPAPSAAGSRRRKPASAR